MQAAIWDAPSSNWTYRITFYIAIFFEHLCRSPDRWLFHRRRHAQAFSYIFSIVSGDGNCLSPGHRRKRRVNRRAGDILSRNNRHSATDDAQWNFQHHARQRSEPEFTEQHNGNHWNDYHHYHNLAGNQPGNSQHYQQSWNGGDLHSPNRIKRYNSVRKRECSNREPGGSGKQPGGHEQQSGWIFAVQSRHFFQFEQPGRTNDFIHDGQHHVFEREHGGQLNIAWQHQRQHNRK